MVVVVKVRQGQVDVREVESGHSAGRKGSERKYGKSKVLLLM